MSRLVALQAKLRAEGYEEPPAPPPRGRRRRVLALVAAVAAVVIGVVVIASRDESPEAPAPAARTPAAPTPQATAAPPAPTADPAEVVSAARELAADAEPGQEIGRILLPDVEYEQAIVQGAALRDLRRNAGHYVSTALPGQRGVVGIAARLTRGGPPFGVLADVEVGSQLRLEMPYGTFTYRVDRVRTVPLRDTSALRDTAGSGVVLTAVDQDERLVIAASPA